MLPNAPPPDYALLASRIRALAHELGFQRCGVSGIDLGAMMIEELALALPEYPRAEGVAFEAAPDEDAPDTRRPFADLDKLLRSRDPD